MIDFNHDQQEWLDRVTKEISEDPLLPRKVEHFDWEGTGAAQDGSLKDYPGSQDEGNYRTPPEHALHAQILCQAYYLYRDREGPDGIMGTDLNSSVPSKFLNPAHRQMKAETDPVPLEEGSMRKPAATNQAHSAPQSSLKRTAPGSPTSTEEHDRYAKRHSLPRLRPSQNPSQMSEICAHSAYTPSTVDRAQLSLFNPEHTESRNPLPDLAQIPTHLNPARDHSHSSSTLWSHNQAARSSAQTSISDFDPSVAAPSDEYLWYI